MLVVTPTIARQVVFAVMDTGAWSILLPLLSASQVVLAPGRRPLVSHVGLVAPMLAGGLLLAVSRRLFRS